MSMTFRRKLTFTSFAGIAVPAVAALWLLPQSGTAGVAAALFAAIASVRVLRTTYTLTDNGLLVIRRGWMSRTQTVRVSDIVRAEKAGGGIRLTGYILIEYGAERLLSIQPDKADDFLAELRKRQPRQ